MADVRRTVQILMEVSCVDAEMALTSTLITEHVHVCRVIPTAFAFVNWKRSIVIVMIGAHGVVSREKGSNACFVKTSNFLIF